MITTTISGTDINLMAITPELVTLHDISHHLSRIRRFNGATSVGYCVAAHALHVCDLVRKAGGEISAQLAALHHDSHEYLIGDVATPTKLALNVVAPGAWEAFEGIIQRQVLDALRLRQSFATNRRRIHHADMVALATERRDLQPEGAAWPCLDGIEPDVIDIKQRARASDEFWAEAFMERDLELRERLAELMGYQPGIGLGLKTSRPPN